MSRAARDLYRAKLAKLLSVADDEAFMAMLWAIEAIQSGREGAAKDILKYPPEAVTNDPTSPLRVHNWELETLANELLACSKATAAPTKGRTFDCTNFGAAATLVGVLRDLENAEDGVALDRTNVVDDIPRIGHRQFAWQSRFDTQLQLFRSVHLYGGPKCSAQFAAFHGLSISDFVLVGFASYAHFSSEQTLNPDPSKHNLGLAENAFGAAIRLLSLDHSIARQKSSILRPSTHHTGYRRSILRQHPCIVFGRGSRMRAPLRQLVFARITSGLYFDLNSRDSTILNEIGSRFERYCHLLLETAWPDIKVNQSYQYWVNGNRVDAPDTLIRKDGQLRLILECKTKRMPYAAKFEEDAGNTYEGRLGIEKIARGVLQIWRFASHIRQGYVASERLHQGIAGLVVTLDPWMTMARDRHKKVMELANKLASETDPNIIPEDRIPVAICSIEDVEWATSRVDFTAFAQVVERATKNERASWYWPSLLREISPNAQVAKRTFKFETQLVELLPWWKNC